MSAVNKLKLDELNRAFQRWATDHGVVWFDRDADLAEAIADVLNIRLEWDNESLRSRRLDSARDGGGTR